MDTGLLSICGVAFAAVFVLLTLFALVMWGLTALFPATPSPAGPRPAVLPPTGDDLAVIAAITAAMQSVHPDKCITKVEELQ